LSVAGQSVPVNQAGAAIPPPAAATNLRISR
jgi:hypothetical protein